MFAASTRVLVAEDVATMRQMIVEILNGVGLPNVIAVEDGADAWAEISAARRAKSPIQLVLADWQMPHMRGIDLLKKIRSSKEDATLPFVMLTSMSDKAAIVEAARAGVHDYVTKPVNIEMLREKLKTLHSKISFVEDIVI